MGVIIALQKLNWFRFNLSKEWGEIRHQHVSITIITLINVDSMCYSLQPYIQRGHGPVYLLYRDDAKHIDRYSVGHLALQ